MLVTLSWMRFSCHINNYIKPGKIFEVVVTLSSTTVARSINTITSFEWQEKNAGEGKKPAF